MAGITGTLTCDKTIYNQGDTITVTIKCSAIGPSTSEQVVVSGDLTDAAGDDFKVVGAPVTVTHPGQPVPVTVKSVSDGTRTYVQKSYDGSTWVGTAVA